MQCWAMVHKSIIVPYLKYTIPVYTKRANNLHKNLINHWPFSERNATLTLPIDQYNRVEHLLVSWLVVAKVVVVVALRVATELCCRDSSIPKGVVNVNFSHQ